MKKILSLFIALVFTIIGKAQISDPVKWATSVVKKDKVYEIVVTANLQKKWHIYSQNNSKDKGPVPTSFSFTKNPLVTLIGKVKEIGSLLEEMDKNFDTKVRYYSNKVQFVQTVKLNAKVKTTLQLTIEYMTCDDNKCLPPVKKNFTINLQ